MHQPLQHFFFPNRQSPPFGRHSSPAPSVAPFNSVRFSTYNTSGAMLVKVAGASAHIGLPSVDPAGVMHQPLQHFFFPNRQSPPFGRHSSPAPSVAPFNSVRFSTYNTSGAMLVKVAGA